MIRSMKRASLKDTLFGHPGLLKLPRSAGDGSQLEVYAALYLGVNWRLCDLLYNHLREQSGLEEIRFYLSEYGPTIPMRMYFRV